MQYYAITLASATLLFGQSMGHMIMANPVPYSTDSLNNSPLVDAKPGSSGSDYPCKIRSDMWKVDHMNTMSVDTPVELNFTGSASHGGGTCQIAVTLDKQPDHASTFKVIQVFEGGCPTGQDGNSGSHPFSFSVPKGFPNGQATLAWVWYNKIGNREVYMNCAPIEVSGGSDSQDVYDSLPNLYLINLPTSECSTVETSDQIVPHPGQYVLKDSNTLSAATGPSCAASAAAQTVSVKGYQSATLEDGDSYSAPAGGAGGAAQTSAPASSEAQPTSAPVSYGSSSALASSSLITISTVAPGTSADSSAPASYPTMSISSDAGVYGPASTAASAPSPVGTGSTTGGSCSGDTVSCNSDGSQFGLCDNSKIVWQAVAPGTKCVNGAIQKRSEYRHAHVRRHAQNAAKGFHNA